MLIRHVYTAIHRSIDNNITKKNLENVTIVDAKHLSTCVERWTGVNTIVGMLSQHIRR